MRLQSHLFEVMLYGLLRSAWGGVWNLRKRLKKRRNRFLERIYNSYFEQQGAWVGLGAEFEDVPIFPHGFSGVFISNSARIGKNVVIYQHVTIGSNMLKDSKRYGAPTIEDNVYIGCGAKIIGKVLIGQNARIGANCVVVKDVPANSVTIIRGIETIEKDYVLDNRFVSNEI